MFIPCFWMAFTAFSSALSKGVLAFFSSLFPPKPAPGPLLKTGATILSSSNSMGSIGKR